MAARTLGPVSPDHPALERPAPASLRPVLPADAPDVLAAYGSAPDMARQGEVRSPEEAERYVARLVDPTSNALGMGIEVSGRMVGLVGIAVDRLNRNGWVYYWMHAVHRGQGLTSAAVATVADWALGDGGFERLELGHRTNNPASGAVALAAGFVQEGREREKFLIDGARIDVLAYGRLRSDPVPEGRRLPLRPPAPLGR